MATNHAILLPDRHKQTDLFIADVFDNLPIKDDIASMTYPVFSLSKGKDFRQIDYKNGDVSICIAPSIHGLPTIFDKDVLLYCASVLMSEVNQGRTPPKTLRLSTHDLLKATNRQTNNHAYTHIENALKRLAGVLITTDIKTNGIRQVHGFHLIDSFGYIESSFVKDRRVALEITLSDWFYNSIIGKEVLTINREYFRLGKSLERRLYEIARKQCGKQAEWKVSLEALYDKTGSMSPLRKFRFFINKICETNHLPDYYIQISNNDVVTFSMRHEQKQSALALDELPHISPRTIEKAREIVREAGTGWDFYTLQSEFTLSLMQGFKPDKVNGAFINFVKKKVQNRP
jgi:plasmid replication initiation protein